MIHSIIAAVSSFALNTIDTLGYFGVFFLMALESAGIPIPSEVIMPFSGFLAVGGRFNFWILVFLGTLGNLFGSLVFYWVGFKGGRIFVLKYGKYFFFSESELISAEKWFTKYGSFSVFIGRLLPGVRTYISFPAGLVKMDLKKFIFYTTLGAAPWVWLFTEIGFRLGERWAEIEKYFRQFDVVIVILAALAVIWHVKRHFAHNREKINL